MESDNPQSSTSGFSINRTGGQTILHPQNTTVADVEDLARYKVSCTKILLMEIELLDVKHVYLAVT